MRRFGTFGFWVIALAIWMAVWTLPMDQVFAHGGHGKPEIQFKVLPKQVEDAQKPVIQMGDIKVDRDEFFTYVRFVAAFQQKADLLQRDFLLRFWVIEGLSRYYPKDINPLMDRLAKMNSSTDDFKSQMNDWVMAQADLYARISYYYQMGVKKGRDKDVRVRNVLDTFEKHVKMDFLEEFVSFGTMEPTRVGVAAYVAGLTDEQKADVTALYQDPDQIGNVARQKARKRWIEFRRDLMENTEYSREYKEIESLDIQPTKVVATVFEKPITMQQFKSVYGPMPNDINWNAIKKSRLSQLLLATAMADYVDKLGVLPKKYKDKIKLTRKLYVASEMIVENYGPILFNEKSPQFDFNFYRQVVNFANLLRFEKLFLERSTELPAYSTLWVDEDYLKTVNWTVQPAFTPKQATYF